MKKALLLLLILLFSSVSATEINAPKEIPTNINWSFSVELNSSDSFTETEIYFDELLIATAFNDKQPVIQEDFVLKAFLFDKKPEDNTGLTVFISYFGITEGKHKIKTKTFNGNNLTEEKEFELNAVDTITAIESMPDKFKQDVDIIMKSIINKINESRNELQELKNSTEQNIQEKVSALEQEINSLEETLNELNELKVEQETEPIEKQKTEEENEIKAAPKENGLTGFYNFSVNNAWMGVTFLIVLLVLLALFQLYKIRSGQTVFEEELEDKDLEEQFEEETSLEKIEETIPKKPERKGKFSIRDLLKR